MSPRILILTEHPELSDEERNLLLLLTEQSRRVSVMPVDEATSSDVEEASVVVLACVATPSFVRAARAPVIALRAASLAGLGMTGRAMRDSGEVEGTAMVGLIAAAQRILPESVLQEGKFASLGPGWGRPGERALVLAQLEPSPSPTAGSTDERTGTVGDAATQWERSPVFLYEGGTRMAAGRAPGDRIAFLLPLATDPNTTSQVRSLLAPVIDWTLGRAPTVGSGSQGQWFWGDHPTRVLSVDEYRTWAREQVEKQIFWRLARVWGVVGSVAVVGLASLGSYMIKTELKWIQTEVTGSVGRTVAEKVPGEVGQIAVGSDQFRTVLKEKVAEAWADPQVQARLAMEIEDTIKERHLLTNMLLEQAITTLNNSGPVKRRESAISNIGVWGSGDPNAHAALLEIIESEDPMDQDERLRIAALQVLTPMGAGHPHTPDSLSADAKSAHRILDRLARESVMGDTLVNAYTGCLAAFPADLAQEFSQRVCNFGDPSGAAEIVVEALLQMEGEKPVYAMLDIASGVRTAPAIRSLGWRGLADLDVRRVTLQTRIDVLGRMWRSIASSVHSEPEWASWQSEPGWEDLRLEAGLLRQDRPLAAYLQAVVNAVNSGDQALLRELLSHDFGSSRLRRFNERLIRALEQDGVDDIRHAAEPYTEIAFLEFLEEEPVQGEAVSAALQGIIGAKTPMSEAFANFVDVSDLDRLLGENFWPEKAQTPQGRALIRVLLDAWIAKAFQGSLPFEALEANCNRIADSLEESLPAYEWSRLGQSAVFVVEYAAADRVTAFLEAYAKVEADEARAGQGHGKGVYTSTTDQVLTTALRREDVEDPERKATAALAEAIIKGLTGAGGATFHETLRERFLDALVTTVGPDRLVAGAGQLARGAFEPSGSHRRASGLVEFALAGLESPSRDYQLRLLVLRLMAARPASRSHIRALESANALGRLDELPGGSMARDNELFSDVIGTLRERMLWYGNIAKSRTIMPKADVGPAARWQEVPPVGAPDEWFKLPQSSTHSYVVTARNGVVEYIVVAEDQKTVVAQGAIGALTSSQLFLARGGERYLRISRPEKQWPADEYVVRAESVPELAIDEPRTIAIDPEAGEAWFRFPGEGGTTYVLRTDNLQNTDTVIELFNHATDWLDENDDVSEDDLSSKLRWECPEDGEYLVRMTDLEENGGAFDLVISKESPDGS